MVDEIALRNASVGSNGSSVVKVKVKVKSELLFDRAGPAEFSLVILLAIGSFGCARPLATSAKPVVAARAAASPSGLAAGNYIYNGEIFYSNGAGGYCAFANWTDYMLLGGQTNLKGVTTLAALPSGIHITTDCAVPASVSLNVDSFGADPTGSADSSSAIQTAINTAIAGGRPSRILLSPGTYKIACPTPTASGQCLSIQNANNLSFVGSPSQLVITNPLDGLLLVTGSTNVQVANLTDTVMPYLKGYEFLAALVQAKRRASPCSLDAKIMSPSLRIPRRE